MGESRSTEGVVAGGVSTGSSGGEGEGGSAAATDFASTLSGGPRDSLSVLICLNLALVYIRKGDIKACEVGLTDTSPANAGLASTTRPKIKMVFENGLLHHFQVAGFKDALGLGVCGPCKSGVVGPDCF